MTLPWTAPLPLAAPVSGPPQWIEPIADDVISNALTHDITWTGDYEAVLIDLLRVVPVTTNTNLRYFTSSDGGANFDVGATDYRYQTIAVTAGNVQAFAQVASNVHMLFHSSAYQSSNFADGGYTLLMTIPRPFRSQYTGLYSHGGYYGTNGPGSAVLRSVGERKEVGRVDGIRFQFDGGSNISTGRIRAWGILPWGAN